jgi:8-oxo-dGTP pyrophosphatase MutT (NUDIX family)
MPTNLEIHVIQSGILLTLLFQPLARFSQLNKLKVPSDQFNFHLKALMNANLIEKTDNGLYRLTAKGKEFANRFDTDQKEIERQAKIGVLICCTRKKEGYEEYLLQQRLKQPYYGFWGFITGKVRWGESILETAKREFEEETGLLAEFKLSGIKHKTDYDTNDVLLEDKFFFVILGKNPKGKLKDTFEGGKNKWIKKGDITKIKELFSDVNKTLEIAMSKQITFTEVKFNADKY